MDMFVLLGVIAVIVLALTIHESAHALVADRLGDPTARLLGRITLNPIPHIDLFSTILLPGLLWVIGSPILFGGAKPVPVVFANLRKPWRDMALVAIAGPASNLLQAFFWAGLLSLLVHSGWWVPDSSGVQILQAGIFANIMLTVLNLMPIPPLDGSRVMAFLLQGEARRAYLSLERIGIFLVLALLLWVPAFNHALSYGIFTLGNWVASLTQLPVYWIPAQLLTPG